MLFAIPGSCVKAFVVEVNLVLSSLTVLPGPNDDGGKKSSPAPSMWPPIIRPSRGRGRPAFGVKGVRGLSFGGPPQTVVLLLLVELHTSGVKACFVTTKRQSAFSANTSNDRCSSLYWNLVRRYDRRHRRKSISHARTNLKKRSVGSKIKVPLSMALASVNHCLACCGVNLGNVHGTAASCLNDANSFTSSADCMFGMTAERSIVVFMSAVPHSVLVLIEGCATSAKEWMT